MAAIRAGGGGGVAEGKTLLTRGMPVREWVKIQAKQKVNTIIVCVCEREREREKENKEIVFCLVLQPTGTHAGANAPLIHTCTGTIETS